MFGYLVVMFKMLYRLLNKALWCLDTAMHKYAINFGTQTQPCAFLAQPCALLRKNVSIQARPCAFLAWPCGFRRKCVESGMTVCHFGMSVWIQGTRLYVILTQPHSSNGKMHASGSAVHDFHMAVQAQCIEFTNSGMTVCNSFTAVHSFYAEFLWFDV